jgi:hypothetical protein
MDIQSPTPLSYRKPYMPESYYSPTPIHYYSPHASKFWYDPSASGSSSSPPPNVTRNTRFVGSPYSFINHPEMPSRIPYGGWEEDPGYSGLALRGGGGSGSEKRKNSNHKPGEHFLTRAKQFHRKLQSRNYDPDHALTFDVNFNFSDHSRLLLENLKQSKEVEELTVEDGKSGKILALSLLHLTAKFHQPLVKKLQATVLWEIPDHDPRPFILREFQLKYVPSFKFVWSFIRKVLYYPLSEEYMRKFASYNTGKHLEQPLRATVKSFWKIEGIHQILYHPHVGILEIVFDNEMGNNNTIIQPEPSEEGAIPNPNKQNTEEIDISGALVLQEHTE